MRTSKKLIRAISGVTAAMLWPATSRADFSYNFDGLTGSASPGTQLIASNVPGTAGQDNWLFTFPTSAGQPPVVRNDAMTGFNGNYVTSQIANQTSGASDVIFTRLGANLGLGTGNISTFQFDGLVGPAGYTNGSGATQYRRSEIMPGIDSNVDGDIRGTGTSAENNEIAFQFGYEATGSGWFVRRASYSNTATVTALTNASGTYRMQLVVDFSANPTATVPDGAGTLYVKQLADASGNPVNDVFRLADPTTANVNLGLSSLGALGAANPANWNGVSARTANNGGIDNIIFTNGLPTSTSTWAANAGNWLSQANWYLSVPNGIDAQANFTTAAGVNSTVYADTAVTAGTVTFNNTNTYVVSGAGSLTMQTSAGSASINVQSAGTQKINLPLIIAGSTTLSVASGGVLKISDPITVNSGVSLSQTGLGTVQYESTVTVLGNANMMFGNSSHVAGLSVASTGSAVLAAGNDKTLRVDNLSLSGRLDLKDNRLITPAAVGSWNGSNYTGVTGLVKSGRNNGGWAGNGIVTSQSDAVSGNYTSIGVAQASQIRPATATATALWNGQTITGTDTLVMYTYGGDANLDGKLNIDDYVAIDQGIAAGLTGWSNGDFNYDGKVNIDDYTTVIDSNIGNQNGVFGSAAGESLSGVSAVPEPSAGLLVIGAASLLYRRRRK